ncbi:50S ribosomal protein L10 [Candidatus Karelsulcia muelleri]
MNKSQQLLFLRNLLVTPKRNFYFITFNGIKAFQQSYFRQISRTKKIKIKVVKNTLLKQSLKRTNKPTLLQIIPFIKYNTTLLWSKDNKATAALLVQFTHKYNLKMNKIFKFALSEDNLYLGEKGLKALINMKSKDELLKHLIATLGLSIRNTLWSLKIIFRLLCNLKHHIIYKYEHKKHS